MAHLLKTKFTHSNLNLPQAASLEIKIISVELKVEPEVHRGGGAFDWDEGHVTSMNNFP